MAMVWKLGDFTDGKIVREVVPVDGGSSQVSVDIHSEDTAEIGIVRKELTTVEDNAWRTTFAPLLTCVGVCDDSKAWNAPGAVLYAGFVNKLSNDIAPGIISAQLAGPNEYTKARIVADTDTPVTDPTTSVTFSGATPEEAMCAAVIKCFSAEGIPAGKPVPPRILGTIKQPTGTAFSITIDVTSVKTYHDVLKAIAEKAGTGLEWRFVPRWASAAMDAWVWDFVTGTTANPHIGEGTTVNLVLSENSAKFSSYSTIIDSNDLYSKLYIQSKSGDKEAKNGADFSMASVSDTEFPILVERFFNPGVELTAEELTAQLNARLAFAAKTKYETNFSVEEKWDVTEWLGRVGNTLSISGVNGTKSAGHDALVRCVGISFTPGKGTVKAELMQLGPTYPRLPKDRTQGNTKPVGNDRPLMPTMPSMGGGVPVIPAPVIPAPGGFGVDGVLSPDDLWGSEGRNPWDTNKDKKVIQNVAFSDFLEKEYVFTDFKGKYPIDPITSFLDSGNRVYGLDHLNQAAATKFENDGVHVHFMGGLNKSTGLPLNGWAPFYIKKTFVANGELGPIEELDVVTPEMIKGMMADYEDQPYSNGGYYRTSVMATNWTSNGRYYFCLMHRYDHSEKSLFEYTDDYNNAKYITNTRASIISKAINESSGKLEGEWKTEPKDLLPEWFFPVNASMSRYGKNILFTNFLMINPRKVKNEDGATIKKDYDDFKNQYSYDQETIYNAAKLSPMVHPTINVRTSKDESAYLWPSSGNPNTWGQLETGALRKGFGDSGSTSSLQKVGSGFHGNSASSEGYLVLQSGYYVALQADKMTKGATQNYPTGSSHGQDYTVSGGNFILFGVGSNDATNTREPAAWAINAQMPHGSSYKRIKNDIVPKFEFWAGGYDDFSNGSRTYSEAGFRDFWQPGFGSSTRGAYTSPSDTMSYSGGLYKFILSGQDRVILHSLKVIEDPNPPAPPVTP